MAILTQRHPPAALLSQPSSLLKAENNSAPSTRLQPPICTITVK